MVRTWGGRILAGIAAAAALACAEEEEPLYFGEEAIFCGTGKHAPGRFTWREESASLEGTSLDGMRLEVGSARIPLDWCRADTAWIDFSLRRLLPADASPSPTRPQIWLLVGGPGRSGEHMLGMVPFFAALDFEVLIPDYRGVGGSAPLHCDGAGEFSEECMERLRRQWGEQTVHFSTTNIALDLGQAIEALRNPGQAVFVYGSSYGSAVGHRYLSLFPEQASGVILDGICPSTGCEVPLVDLNHDRVLRETLESCGDHPFCRSKMGPDPTGAIADLLLRLGKGHCREAFPGGDTSLATEVLYGTLTDHSGLRIGLSFAHRLRRCEPQDVAALRHFFAMLEEEELPPRAPLLPGDSDFQSINIVFSEFWDESIDAGWFAETSRHLLLKPSGVVETFIDLRPRWTWARYDTPTELLRWAETRTPLLLLNGTLDTRTTVAGLAGIEQVYRSPIQRFHAVPWTGHVTLRSEPLGEDGYHRCVGPMVRHFLDNPAAPVDASCLDGLEPPPFEGDPDAAMAVFGTMDLWENEPEEDGVEALGYLGDEGLRLRRHLRALVKGASPRPW